MCYCQQQLAAICLIPFSWSPWHWNFRVIEVDFVLLNPQGYIVEQGSKKKTKHQTNSLCFIMLLFSRMPHLFMCSAINWCSIAAFHHGLLSFEPHWWILNARAWAVNALDSSRCQKEGNKAAAGRGLLQRMHDDCWGPLAVLPGRLCSRGWQVLEK